MLETGTGKRFGPLRKRRVRRESSRAKRAAFAGTRVALLRAVDEDQIRRALSGVVDPELGLDVVALGLVYRAEQTAEGIEVDLTMTTPSCPLGEHIREEAERAIAAAFPGVRARVNLVWSPPWQPERMSAGAKAALGW